MRIIDADALIEGYKHMGYDPTEHPEESYMEGWCKGFNSATDHCMHHVIHAPTVEQPEQRWIPCSKRLPENRRYVLVTYQHEYGLIDHGITWYGEAEKKWDTSRNVVAWMPLPEPYRGGETE